MKTQKLINDKNFNVRLKAAIDKRFMESGLKEMALNGAKEHSRSYQEVQKEFFDSIDELEVDTQIDSWISVKDKLPENDNNILLYNGETVLNGWAEQGEEDGKYDQFFYGGNQPLFGVTHWQVPQPPL